MAVNQHRLSMNSTHVNIGRKCRLIGIYTKSYNIEGFLGVLDKINIIDHLRKATVTLEKTMTPTVIRSLFILSSTVLDQYSAKAPS